MKDQHPNILLIMTDQQRGDCLGIEGHPVLQTPCLDQLASSGIRFRKAYSACPVCVPARRTLISGQKASSHGVFENYHTQLKGATLPGELAKAGYQTHLVGKLHLYPGRKLYGFNSADWADSSMPSGVWNDYERFLETEGIRIPKAAGAHGMKENGWNVRAFHLDERYHFTNWCVDRSLEFLERRDPTVPFFLNVSFHQPHTPCTPPLFYYNRYMNMDIPEPYVADWARVFDEPVRGLPITSWRTALEPAVMKQYRAAYYGCINHIDDQISRLLTYVPNNTIILFCSDHGDMLGDHQWIRKRNAFEPSAHVPFIMKLPETMGIEQGSVREEVVELMDIMPTLLDAADVPIPETVDGQSLLPLLRGNPAWRDFIHGEISSIPTLNTGMQYLTNGKRKYIWYPGLGQEQYFNLEEDPHEMSELSADPRYATEVAGWRELLARELEKRPEAFSDGVTLHKTEGPTPSHFPAFERV